MAGQDAVQMKVVEFVSRVLDLAGTTGGKEATPEKIVSVCAMVLFVVAGWLVEFVA